MDQRAFGHVHAYRGVLELAYPAWLFGGLMVVAVVASVVLLAKLLPSDWRPPRIAVPLLRS